MRPALLIICAAVACARAATVARDLAVLPALETADSGQNLPQKPVENNSSEEELVQQTITADQVSNDLRSQVLEEVHIPVEIVQEVYPALKSTADVNEQKDSENEVKPPKAEDIPDEEDEVETPKPGYIQQGIQTLQALQQAATLTIQNALKPQNDEQPAPGGGNNLLQQSFNNLQHAVQYGIQSINQTVGNILNGNPDTQSEEGANSQNLITTIQHNFQNSLAQFNQTFQNFIHPSESSKPESSANDQKISQVASELKLLNQQFNIGLKSASDGLQAITSPKEETATAKPTGPSNPFNNFQQLVQNWYNTAVGNIQNINSTIFGQGQTQTDESGSKPNIFQQIGQNIQNILPGQRPSQGQSGESGNVTKPTNGPFQNWFPGLQQNQGGNSSGAPSNFFQQALQGFQQNILNVVNGSPNPRPPATGGASAPPAIAVAAVGETSSKRTLIESNYSDKNSVETADKPRKKGGGDGSSGDNNDFSSSGGRLEKNAEVKPKPEEAPEIDENVKPADRVITE